MKNEFDINTYNFRFNKNQNKSSDKAILIVLMLIGIGLFLVGAKFLFRIGNTNNLSYELCDLIALGLSVLIWFFCLVPHIFNIYQRVLFFLVIDALLYLFIRNHQYFFINTIQLLTGIMGILTGLVQCINAWQARKDDLDNYINCLVWALVYFTLGILILRNTRLLAIYLGLYMMILAINIFSECFKAYFRVSIDQNGKPHRIILLPTLISAFIPIGFYNRFSNFSELNPDDNLILSENPDENEPEENLTIYIHMLSGLIPGLGHVDLSLNDTAYCYGNFDESTWILGGFIADGTFALIPKDKHINYALNKEKKILLAYSVKISEDIKNQIQNRISEIMENSYEWETKAEQAQKGEIPGDPNSFTDVGSIHFRESGAKFYKFNKKSPYRTYFALGSNCAKVANDIIGSSGINLFNLSGIITPGTFIQYLNELYMLDNSIVVDRKIYMLNKNGKPYVITGEDEKKLEKQMKIA